MKLAGIMQTKNYGANGDWKVFEQLRSVCDKVIVLDHNSTIPFPHAKECDVYMQLRNQEWNDPSNAMMLMWQAHRLGCDWVMRMDDDMFLSSWLRDRSYIVKHIAEAEHFSDLSIRHTLYECWGSRNQFRKDGIWNHKKWILFSKNWFAREGCFQLPNNCNPLHFNHALGRSVYSSSSEVYHTGCITAQQRAYRVHKYKKLDPENKYQSDYNYMLDETGLKLADVPQGDRFI